MTDTTAAPDPHHAAAVADEQARLERAQTAHLLARVVELSAQVKRLEHVLAQATDNADDPGDEGPVPGDLSPAAAP